MTETVQERVARGAAWLDEQKPGWEDLIDFDTLDLSSCSLCVVGQVFACGPYEASQDFLKHVPPPLSELRFRAGRWIFLEATGGCLEAPDL